MQYLTLLIFLLSTTCFGQSFGEKIAHHREEYKADFVKNEHSPLKEVDLKHLNFYEADSTYQILASVELLHNEKAFKMPTYAGTTADTSAMRN